MLLAAHQPNYLPNLSFFYKMSKADHFIVFTNAQFAKGDHWVRRHKIRGANNDILLTIPVHGSSQHSLIKEILIDNSGGWRKKHRINIQNAYAKTSEKAALGRILAHYDREWRRLADLNWALILCLRDLLGITTPITLDEEVTGKKEQLLVNLCKSCGADEYLSGAGGREYMTEQYFEAMERNGITHHFVDRNLTPLYPYSAVHYLFTHGIDAVRAALRSEQAALPMA